MFLTVVGTQQNRPWTTCYIQFLPVNQRWTNQMYEKLLDLVLQFDTLHDGEAIIRSKVAFLIVKQDKQRERRWIINNLKFVRVQ